MPQSSVFLSYRRDDSAGYAGRLHDDLADYFGDGQVFMDVQDVAPGLNFRDTIIQVLEQCAAVLPLVGPSWLGQNLDGQVRLGLPNDYVRLELREALARRKPLIPLLVNGARIPAAADLPEDVSRLLQFNFLELSDTRWRHDFNVLTTELESLGISPKPFVAFPAVPPFPRGDRRDTWLVAGTLEAVEKNVIQVLNSQGLGVSSQRDHLWSLQGGSKTKTRVMGLPLVKDSDLPLLAMIRFTDRRTRVQVEALIHEDWGPGFLDPSSKRRFTQYFDWLLQLIRRQNEP
jgi:hypothetical protein